MDEFKPTVNTKHILQNIHWEAGKEHWFVLLCNNYSFCVRIRCIIKTGLEDTKKASS